MDSRVPPYPPPPRHAPPELGRRSEAPAAVRAAGIVAHLAGVALYAGAPAVAAAGAVSLLRGEETHLIVQTGGFAVCTVLAFVYAKSLLPRRLPSPPAVVPVDRDHQPTAYAFVDRVAQDLGVAAPRRLFAGSGAELRLGGRRSLVDLVRAPRWELHVGLWLWHAVTLSEFQALVARTLAPTAGGRPERFRSTVRTLLEALTDGVDRVDEAAAASDSTLAGLARVVRGLHRGLVLPLRVAGRLLLRIDPARDDSRSDDLAAVRVAGSDALVHAILRSDFAAAALREADEALGRAASHGLWTSDLYDHLTEAARALREAHHDFTLGEPPVLRGPNAGKQAEVFEPGRRYLSNMWDGFPPPDDREQHAKREFVAAERDDRPAADLLDGPTGLRERLTALRYVEVLETDTDYIPVAAGTIRRWMNTPADRPFPARYAGCYDGGRALELGTTLERQDALAAEPWDDARLLATATSLYARSAERAASWQASLAKLERLLQKTLYRPAGRQRALAEDLEDDARKAGRWLGALDRWAYVVHVHMAARLRDLSLHEAILARYESVLRFQPLASAARRQRNRVAAWADRLSHVVGHTPYRLGRDAAQEFAGSRRDFGVLLADAAAIRDPMLRELVGDVRLDDFLYSHVDRPPTRARGTFGYGRRLLAAWAEVEGKARWLHYLGVRALLELHEQIEREFDAELSPGVWPSTNPIAGILVPPPAGLEDDRLPRPKPDDTQIIEELSGRPAPPAPPASDEDFWAGAE